MEERGPEKSAKMETMQRWLRAGVVHCMIAACACTPAPDPPRVVASASREAPRPSPAAPPTSSGGAAAPPRAEDAPQRPAIDPARYPWLDGASELAAVDALEDRIDPPRGFTRVALPNSSFGAFLRRLPLAAPGTPVRSYRGEVILPPDHDNLAAVVALDVGPQDLQQCADSVIRLHAEWLWSQGRRDQSYRAADRTPMPFARWARGERVQARGSAITWSGATRKPDASHHAFRAFLDAVFGWTNTVALARDTTPIDVADLRPGDFVVQPGAPGHAVLVLDLASSADGQRAVLLGQGYMPAQSFQVLRPSPASAWFLLQPDAIKTPFWPAFPWSALRRFPST
jgi:hypothetical protein